MAETLANPVSTAPEQPAQHTPMVSIGMPVYNGENYIREALDSLLAQTFTDFELIISDNASTDGTQAICEAYAANDARIKYIRQSENLGAGKNFEYVLEHSCGKYFMWAAHDDMWAINWLEALINQIRPDDFSLRGSIRYMRNGKIIIERFPQNYKKNDYIRCFMAAETTMNARNFYIYGLFVRSKLMQLDRSILLYSYSPDFIFSYKMLQEGCLRTIADTYQIYRLHTQNGGTKLIENSLSLARLIYRVHPLSYYCKYISISPAQIKPIIFMLSPIKHIYNQMHLWVRGFKKIFLKLENI